MLKLGKVIKLESDYTDYYDDIFSDDGDIIYKRLTSDCMPRGKALKFLSELGVPTIEIGQVTNFNIIAYDKLVVYTNSKQHGGVGKQIVTNERARSYYSNYLATPYIEDTNGVSLKYIQIGRIAIQIGLQNRNNGVDIISGDVTSINRIDVGLNNLIKLPIFSIDYIPVNGIMTAIDFNSAENLGRFGLDKVVTPEEILEELSKIL